ncbi:MAG TPA: hypothetical protein VMU89_23865 [Thermomicrobiaceae bacterium]|nr:hypothetical protein [Thermomicrobiaceae bacterium]
MEFVMLELSIGQLDLELSGAAGQEHRVRDLTARALERLGELVGERWAVEQRLSVTRSVDRLAVAPVGLDLARMSDEAAADALARAMLDALTARLGIV